MTLLVNSFEGGSSAATITTSNAGGNTGYPYGPALNNQFNTVSSVGTLVFDNTRAAHGLLSAKVAAPVSGNTAYVRWDSSLGTQTQIWFRMYLYFTAIPTASSVRIFSYTNSSGTNCATVIVNPTTGYLEMVDTSGTNMITFASAILLNQWFRVEGTVVNSASAGSGALSMYPLDSSTATESHVSAASFDTLANGARVFYGLAYTSAIVSPFWMDDVGVSTTGYLGPVGGRANRLGSGSVAALLITQGVL